MLRHGGVACAPGGGTIAKQRLAADSHGQPRTAALRSGCLTMQTCEAQKGFCFVPSSKRISQ